MSMNSTSANNLNEDSRGFESLGNLAMDENMLDTSAKPSDGNKSVRATGSSSSVIPDVLPNEYKLDDDYISRIANAVNEMRASMGQPTASSKKPAYEPKNAQQTTVQGKKLADSVASAPVAPIASESTKAQQPSVNTTQVTKTESAQKSVETTQSVQSVQTAQNVQTAQSVQTAETTKTSQSVEASYKMQTAPKEETNMEKKTATDSTAKSATAHAVSQTPSQQGAPASTLGQQYDGAQGMTQFTPQMPLPQQYMPQPGIYTNQTYSQQPQVYGQQIAPMQNIYGQPIQPSFPLGMQPMGPVQNIYGQPMQQGMPTMQTGMYGQPMPSEYLFTQGSPYQFAQKKPSHTFSINQEEELEELVKQAAEGKSVRKSNYGGLAIDDESDSELKDRLARIESALAKLSKGDTEENVREDIKEEVQRQIIVKEAKAIKTLQEKENAAGKSALERLKEERKALHGDDTEDESALEEKKEEDASSSIEKEETTSDTKVTSEESSKEKDAASEDSKKDKKEETKDSSKEKEASTLNEAGVLHLTEEDLGIKKKGKGLKLSDPRRTKTITDPKQITKDDVRISLNPGGSSVKVDRSIIALNEGKSPVKKLKKPSIIDDSELGLDKGLEGGLDRSLDDSAAKLANYEALLADDFMNSDAKRRLEADRKLAQQRADEIEAANKKLAQKRKDDKKSDQQQQASRKAAQKKQAQQAAAQKKAAKKQEEEMTTLKDMSEFFAGPAMDDLPTLPGGDIINNPYLAMTSGVHDDTLASSQTLSEGELGSLQSLDASLESVTPTVDATAMSGVGELGMALMGTDMPTLGSQMQGSMQGSMQGTMDATLDGQLGSGLDSSFGSGLDSSFDSGLDSSLSSGLELGGAMSITEKPSKKSKKAPKAKKEKPIKEKKAKPEKIKKEKPTKEKKSIGESLQGLMSKLDNSKLNEMVQDADSGFNVIFNQQRGAFSWNDAIGKCIAMILFLGACIACSFLGLI
jgi:hypothetical protein